MVAPTNLNGLSDPYQLYRLNVAEEVMNAIPGAGLFAQDPSPEIHVEMSALYREFRDLYFKILFAKEKVVPLNYCEDGQVDLAAFKVALGKTGWDETFSKMQKLMNDISAESSPYNPLYIHYLSHLKEMVNNAFFEILTGSIRRPVASRPHDNVASVAASVTSEHVQEIPEELLDPIYRLLSFEDWSKCARVGHAWNRTTKTHVRELAHQYAYGLKELESCLFEGLGPQAVHSNRGIAFGGMFQTLSGSDASSVAFFRSRELVKQNLVVSMTTRSHNFAILQGALQAITNSAAYSHVFQQDVSDCIGSAAAYTDTWHQSRTVCLQNARGFDFDRFTLYWDEWQKKIGKLLNKQIEDRVQHRRFGEAFGLALHRNQFEVVEVCDAAVRRILPIDPELAWHFAHSLPGKPNPQTIAWLAGAIPDSHAQLKQHALQALAGRAVPPAAEEEEHK